MKSKRNKRVVVAVDLAHSEGQRHFRGLTRFLQSHRTRWDLRLKRTVLEFTAHAANDRAVLSACLLAPHGLQMTDFSRRQDAGGSVAATGRVDRTVRREYDEFDRVTKVDHGNGETETFAYDVWGRLAARTRGKLKETYRYDHFGRLVEKDENGTVFSCAYDAWGWRTSRTIRFADGGEVLEERRAYDRYGRLVETAAFGMSVKWRYDAKGRVARQVVDGSPIDFAYTKDGRLAGKWLGGRESPDASVEYEYAKDGRIAARTANGVRQAFAYDARGQLVAVRENGADVERYTYDRAGNMVRKTVRGKTTTFTFDGANQLVSSTYDGVTTKYAYDAAGRLVREGDKTYRYGYLDKVLSVTDGKRSYRYAYHVDGQLARADYGDGRTEGFAWDGLALVRRGGESFVNEPHVGGGSPVVSSKGATYFNDVLGTTVGVREGRGASRKGAKRRYAAAALTAFGEPVPVAATSHNSNIRQFDHSIISFFTGKPQVEGLGRVFLYRNYRADLAKWQTADPLGYPDGWNQLTYCGCFPCCAVDYGGAFLLTCHDYNTVGFAVHSASELSVGHVGADSFGGVFAVYLEDVQITSSGSVYIDLRLNLSIGPGVRHDCEFQSGEISEYGEHTGSLNDSYGRNVTWESVYAHEKGHADVFFSSEIPLIRTILNSYDIDDGSRSQS